MHLLVKASAMMAGLPMATLGKYVSDVTLHAKPVLTRGTKETKMSALHVRPDLTWDSAVNALNDAPSALIKTVLLVSPAQRIAKLVKAKLISAPRVNQLAHSISFLKTSVMKYALLVWVVSLENASPASSLARNAEPNRKFAKLVPKKRVFSSYSVLAASMNVQLASKSTTRQWDARGVPLVVISVTPMTNECA